MADPIVVKVSELTELIDLATGDLITAVDISEAVSANKTKKLQAGNIKIFSTTQLADSIVTVAKLATDAVETSVIKDLNVTTGKLADNSVDATKLRDSAALSVIGNGTNAVANPADIVAGADGQVLRRAGTTVGFGQVLAAGIADNAVTEAKLGSIKRTLVLRVTAPLETVEVINLSKFFPWAVSLNNFVVVDARINLAIAGSTATTVVLSNQGGTMATLSLAASATGMAASGTIAASYKTAITNGFLGANVTAAGTGAAGLSITLVLQGVPS